jgi:hypothetical protein
MDSFYSKWFLLDVSIVNFKKISNNNKIKPLNRFPSKYCRTVRSPVLAHLDIGSILVGDGTPHNNPGEAPP